MKEEWKDIVGYEGLYRVSSLGRVFSVRSGRCLQPYGSGHKNQYLIVDLCVNGQRKHCRIHRLVAEAFLPNPDLLPQVNHINEDGSDNRVENLEWCDARYNNNYGSHKERAAVGHYKPVEQYDLEGNYIRGWISATAAAKELNINQNHISEVCRGKRNTCGGYKWKYH